MGGWIVCTLFGVVVVMGEIAFSVLLVDAVVVVGSRFLGSGRVGGVGRSVLVVFCCRYVVLGKRVIA